MIKREDIDKKYTWNLDRFYENETQQNADIDKIVKLNEKIVSLKGKLNSGDAIFSYFKLDEEQSAVAEKIGAFVMLKLALDGTDKKALALSAKLSNIETKLAKQTAFLNFELAQNSNEFYTNLLKDKRFADYDKDIEDIVRLKPHTLNEEKEKLLTGVCEFCSQEDLFDVLDNVDFKFDDIVMPNGEKKELTNANYVTVMSNENQDVRRQAFENIHKVFRGHNMCLSTNFISNLKKCHFFAEEHNFKSVKQRKFFGDEMPENVLDVLVSCVNENLKNYQEYFAFRKKVLNLKNYYCYDHHVPLVSNVKFAPSYEESIQIFRDVVKPLGKTYWDYVERQTKNRYVDVFETKNKNSGAFNADLNVCNPYVLLNYEPSFYWLSTLSHEFGHMVNTCLINDNQPLAKRGCSIFTAEIASTVNECLLYDYLLETSKDKQFKIFLLDKFLSEFNATVFRQTMFTEFEVFAHDSVATNVPIIYEDLNNFYDGLQKKYFGDKVILPNDAKFEWSRIPHFFSPFYVYSYATGFISACIISQKIKTEGQPFVKKYLDFLASGNSDCGYNTLKKLGIDICDKNTFVQGFGLYESRIKQLKQLLEEKC